MLFDKLVYQPIAHFIYILHDSVSFRLYSVEFADLLTSFFELYHRKNNLSTTSYQIKGQKRINKEKQSDFKHTYRCMVLVIEEPENVIK